jgi:hypothetical protein
MEMTTTIPIIFVHRGLPLIRDRFLRIALRQARLASPANDIFLLTDYPRPYLGAIKQIQIGSLGKPAAALHRAYSHASTNRVEFEKFCFSRWFYVREFMRRASIARACVLDSDVMLFSPIEHLVREFEGFDAGNWSWANVVTSKGADRICQQLMRATADEELRRRILARHGVVSDMTCIAELAGPDVLDQNPLVGKGFDPNFNMIGQRFHFLHFQGPAKALMPALARLTQTCPPGC